MGKILVLYDSTTGNTKAMAEEIVKGAKSNENMEVRLRFVGKATKDDVVWCDGIAVGSPTQMGIISWRMKQFWDNEMQDQWSKVDGKIGCAFSSSGGWGGGSELTCMSILTVLMNFGMMVFGIPDYVADKFTLHYGAIVAGEPREKREIEACQLLGKRLAQWVAYYVDHDQKAHPLKYRQG
jgi:NAD(P)H dehydrogenase (quinone)